MNTYGGVSVEEINLDIMQMFYDVENKLGSFESVNSYEISFQSFRDNLLKETDNHEEIQEAIYDINEVFDFEEEDNMIFMMNNYWFELNIGIVFNQEPYVPILEHALNNKNVVVYTNKEIEKISLWELGFLIVQLKNRTEDGRRSFLVFNTDMQVKEKIVNSIIGTITVKNINE